MTTCIKVEFRTATAAGRLYPRYVADSGIIAIERRVRVQPSTLGLNLDNRIICDLDAEGMALNLDIHAFKRGWHIARSFPPMPDADRKGDLVFPREIIEQRFIIVPVQVIANPSRSSVRILIGETALYDLVVELSDRCVALVHANCLTGLHIDLEYSGSTPPTSPSLQTPIRG